MEHAWTVICRRTITDQETNTVSLIDVIERLEFKTTEILDRLPLQLDIISLWSRTDLNKPEKSKGRLEIIYTGNSQKLHTIEYELDLTETPRTRGKGSIVSILFIGDGLYKFVISLWDDNNGVWREVASVPLEIIQLVSTSEKS